MHRFCPCTLRARSRLCAAVRTPVCLSASFCPSTLVCLPAAYASAPASCMLLLWGSNSIVCLRCAHGSSVHLRFRSCLGLDRMRSGSIPESTHIISAPMCAPWPPWPDHNRATGRHESTPPSTSFPQQRTSTRLSRACGSVARGGVQWRCPFPMLLSCAYRANWLSGSPGASRCWMTAPSQGCGLANGW